MRWYAAMTREFADFPVASFFWFALIFMCLFVCCLFAWKAKEWLRNRKKPSAPGVDRSPTDRMP
jgi:hypothetical protein